MTGEDARAALIDLQGTLFQHMTILDGMPPQWQEEMLCSDLERMDEIIELLDALAWQQTNPWNL